MKLRKNVVNLSVRMSNPTTHFDLMYLNTAYYRLLAREIESSLRAAWDLAGRLLPEIHEFEGKTAWIYIDLHLIAEPETQEERERLVTLARGIVKHEDGWTLVEEAFTNPRGYKGYLMIVLNSVGLSPFGSTILHELLHQLGLDEQVIRAKLSQIQDILTQQGLGEPGPRTAKAYLRTLPLRRRLRVHLGFWIMRRRLCAQAKREK